jgi:hypothetical protein
MLCANILSYFTFESLDLWAEDKVLRFKNIVNCLGDLIANLCELCLQIQE